MEAVIDITERPEVIAEKLDGKQRLAVRNVIWFGTPTERNSFAKHGDHRFETMHDNRLLFGVKHLSLID